MATDSRIDELTQKLAALDTQIKTLEQEKEGYRQTFFALARERVGKEVGLIKKYITVPKTFFLSTKMSEQEFVSTRHPGWLLQERLEDKDTNTIHLLLEENPDYKPWSYTNSVTRQVVSKQIASPPAELDVKTLKADRPDIWKRIMREVTTWEPDAIEIQAAIRDDPTLRETFQFHTRYLRQPTIKLGPIRVAKEDE